MYARKSITGGTAGFRFAVSRAFGALERGTVTLGLFPLHEV